VIIWLLQYSANQTAGRPLKKVDRLVAQAVKAQKDGHLSEARRLLGLAIDRIEELNRARAEQLEQYTQPN
jgi:precorrin-6B methylase 2